MCRPKNKFLESINGRWGFESLYYHSDHVKEGEDGFLNAGINLPWYWRISRFASNSWDKFYWLKKILSLESGWGRYDSDYEFGIHSTETLRAWFFRHFFKRVFYTFKCIVCMFFFRRRRTISGYFDKIDIAIFDIGPMGGEYSGEAWSACAVGYGIFRNWYFREYSDSSC